MNEVIDKRNLENPTAFCFFDTFYSRYMSSRLMRIGLDENMLLYPTSTDYCLSYTTLSG